MKIQTNISLMLILATVFATSSPAYSQTVTEVSFLTDEIIPEVSILGLKYGSPEKTIISQCGQPIGTLTLTKEISVMVYPRGVGFLLKNSLLAGAVIKSPFLPFGIEWLGSKPETPTVAWKLPNGVSASSTMGDVVKIFEIGNLGLDPKLVYRYNPGAFSLALTFDRRADHVPESHQSRLTEFDLEYSVSGLLVGEFSVVDLVFQNGRF